jgi:serine/threonine protein kinase/tetratricopeptide (TPR) repeat protein
MAEPPSREAKAMAAIGSVVIEIGTVLGGRYEIQKLLGMGGMGAVYQARDRELDRPVGVKVIRPDLAGNPEILARFKRELILARQVTHRNIIRIFDLSEADGLKFITMEFIDGEDLRGLFVREKKLAPEMAVDIMLQVSRGLLAAHAEGVIHRDLKPSNIMRDSSGRVVVMDFGLARTMVSDGMTQTGLMIGTMEYMSPEQAMGMELDARSDLFAMGLIFYEALSGDIPFRADSAVASLVKRTVENAKPLQEFDASVPEGLSAIVSKCLEREPAQRYSSAEEIIQDLEAWRGKSPLTNIGRNPFTGASILPGPAIPAAQPPARQFRWKWVAAGSLGLVLLAGVGVVVRSRIAGPVKIPSATGPHKTLTVLVSDFHNATSDSVFDSTLEPAYALALEGASFISVYNGAQAHTTLAEIKPGTKDLDEANARLVATREGIDYVVSGSITRTASGYQLFSKVSDARTGKAVATEQTEAPDKNNVLRAVATLASQARTSLGDTSSESAKVAEAETFTSDSIEASHEYADAQEARYAGKQDEAIKGFQRAIELDPKFGSAYGNLAALYWNAGNQAEAINYYKLAMQHIDRMTDREKYRTRGGYYLAVSDGEKAVEEFSELVKQYPADSMGLSALAHAYYLRHDMAKAVEVSQRAIEIYPKNVVYRNNAALYAIFAGDFATAERLGNSLLQIKPNYEDALTTLALCVTEKGDYDRAVVYWTQEANASADGASVAFGGLADLALYRSDLSGAQSALNKGIESDLAAKNENAAGKKYVVLAETLLLMGKKAEALQATNRGLALAKADANFAAARVYTMVGDTSKAGALAAQLDKSVEAQPQAFGKIIEGDIQMSRGHAKEAAQLYQESERLVDSWLARFDLARAYIEQGAFTDASTELENCIRRRGEATDIYIDEQQTFRYFPPTYYYMGRALEGMKSAGAIPAYKKFLAMKVANAQDPLVEDAQNRLAKLQQQ